MVLWVIYVAGLGVIVVIHIDQGLSKAIDLASGASDIPVWTLTILLFFIPFMGAGAVFGLMRLKQPFGVLEIHAHGLLLACYTLGPLSLSGSGEWFPWGFADWSNLAPAGVFRLSGFRCMGLRFIDLEAFLVSRQKLTREDLVGRTRLGPQWGRFLMSWGKITPIGKFLEVVWTVRGLTVPKSTEENDVLTWNQENYGFHIIVDSCGPGYSLRSSSLGGVDRKAATNRNWSKDI
jgi:hypothetical protein